MLRKIRTALRHRFLGIANEVADRQYARHEKLARQLHGDLETLVRREVDRIVQAVQDVEFRARRDIYAAAERNAVDSTERFVRAQLPKVTSFPHPLETLQHALGLAPTGGMALEFGVFSGGTLKVITTARDRREVYGFDSFQGLPEDWRTNIPKGTFHVDQLPEVDGAKLVVGWFADTLPEFLESHPGPVDFVHIDADLYSSTKTVLQHVGPRLRPGTIILFDEYFNYPGWEHHEHKAWQEFIDASGLNFEYVCYTSNNEQLAVRITEPNAM